MFSAVAPELEFYNGRRELPGDRIHVGNSDLDPNLF